MNRLPILFAASAVAAAVVMPAVASADIVLNEFFVNPPGGDNGQEYLEFLSTTGGVESLAGLSLLNIEGDAGGGNGTIDKVIDLGSLSTGTNGLLLYRDSATVLNPAPAPETNVFVQDFDPDIENPAGTFLLVSGFTGLQGDDIDADDDGTADNTPWASVVDAVSFADPDNGATTADGLYAAQFGGVEFYQDDLGFGIELFFRSSEGNLIVANVDGANPGPYPINAANADAAIGLTATPGSLNPSVAVPEPASLAVFGLVAVATLARRRRQA